MEDFDKKIRHMAERGKLDTDSHEVDQDKELVKILETANNWQAPELKSKEESWNRLTELIDKPETKIKNKQSKKRVWYSIAASISIILVSFICYKVFVADISMVATKVAETRTFYLPDNSKVVLNAESSLEYDEDDFIKNREVMLSGQAFFEVEKGKNFRVISGGIVTEVLGTSFHVYNRNGRVEVGCTSGKVQVSDADSEFVLSMGEKVKASGNKLDQAKTKFDPEKAITWTNGKFYYSNTDLNIVIKEIEIQFGVEIIGMDFNNRFYTGYFDNKNLESALKQVLTPMGYSFEVNNKTIIVN